MSTRTSLQSLDLSALLEAAEARGVRITTEDDRIRIRGPKRAEPIVAELSRRRADLRAHYIDGIPLETPPTCPDCGSSRWWSDREDPRGTWWCATCHDPRARRPHAVWWTATPQVRRPTDESKR